jgi:phosphate transport system permease protein
MDAMLSDASRTAGPNGQRLWERQRATGRLADPAFAGLVRLLGAGIPVLVLLIVVKLLEGALPALKRFGPGFLAGTAWDPVRQVFGALPFIYGTLVTSALALLIAGPVALGTAIFLAELAPGWLRGVTSSLVELLAAIPSVVYGLWGIFVLAPFLRTIGEPLLAATLGFLPLFQGPAYGVGLLAGGLILAIMIIPTIAAVSRDVIRSVPTEQREAMLALGATRWETIRWAVLPMARPGIAGAVLLGLGRALGETMAVTMVIGNRPEIHTSLFAPGYTMAAVIANEFTEATDDLYLSALTAVGFGLLLVTVLVNAVARLLVWRMGGGAKG